MLGLSAQIKAFLLTYLLGIIAGFIFHFYQLMIKNRRVGKYSLYLMDLVLWIAMIVLVFTALLLINQGEMRIYVFIALLAGIISYYKCIAGYTQKPLSFTAGILVAIIKKTLFYSTQPIRKVIQIGSQLFKHWCQPPPANNPDPE